MKKLFIRFFLLLCIFLLGGYSHLYAHTYQDRTGHSPVKILQSQEQGNFGILQVSQGLNTYSVRVHKEKEYRKKFVTENEGEEEVEELISSKKYSEYSKYFTSGFYALIIGYFFRCLTNYLPFCKQFSYSSPQKLYLIFQVIRI
jgi:hypothetical protein